MNLGFVSKNCPLISSVMFIFIRFLLFVASDLFILNNFVLFMTMCHYLSLANVSVVQTDH